MSDREGRARHGPGDAQRAARPADERRLAAAELTADQHQVAGPVTSPTFTIGHLYEGDVEIAHLDLYRLTEIDPAILEDYVTPDRIAFVEWPAALEEATLRVKLEHAGGDRRTIEIE
jgi:tRNA A37 threonylcarbamoyladenosine biosynthesis protein TsaE